MDTTHSKSRLLLVDGDPKSLRVLDVSLKKAGFDVASATSGREALALLEASQPDLIISDTDLDEMDGFDLCRSVKARPEWAKIPFLFVSGRKSIEDKIRGLELGVDDYLTKPIYIKEIGIRVRTALQRAERERMESRREGRTRFAGDLSDVGVVDLVQTIELNRKSGIIHIVNRDGRRGSIFFRDGKVIDAEVGRLSGESAMYRLFSWSEGQFAVEFKQIRRHDVIETSMAPLLMEGMRRLDESALLLERLPPHASVLEVDCRTLAEELAELPDEMNSVLRLCDGTRTLQEVVEDSEHPDLEALTIISKLFATQIVFARDVPDRPREAEPKAKLAHWLSQGGAEDGVAAEDTVEASESSLPLRPDGELIPEKTPRPTLGASAPPRSGEPEDPANETAPPGRNPAASEAASAAESLSAVLPVSPEPAERTDDLAVSGGTLKGIPIGNLFGAADEPSPELPSEPAILQAPVDSAAVQAPLEVRSTKPLGLAERLLSEDSAVRVSAMHEAIAEDGRVQNPAVGSRQTREYGNPDAFSAAALVDEVVSSSHEIHRLDPPPAPPEKPSKEVDWGSWPTSAEGPAPPATGKTVRGFSAAATESASGLLAVTAESSVPPAAQPTAKSLALAGQAADGGVIAPPNKEPVLVGAAVESSEAAPLAPAGAAPDDARASENASEPWIGTAEESSEPRGEGPTSRRGVWAAVAAAFVLGVLGYLVLGKRSSVSMSLPPPAIQAPPPAVVPPKALPPVPAVRPSITPSPVKARQPLLGVSADDLLRKCRDADDGGKGKAKTVAAVCRPALEANPQDTDLMAILTRAEIDRGRLAEAKVLAKRMLAADAKRFDAYVFLGTAEQEAGNVEEARAAYRRYLELAPDGPFARELRAILDNL